MVAPTVTSGSSPEAMVSIRQLSARRILVINSKGGSGKTTVATNLAAWLSTRGEPTVLLDADPQASSQYWLSQRNSQLPTVVGVKIDEGANTTRSFQWRAPKSTRWLITDAPPGLKGPALEDLLQDHDMVVIPVLASDVDIRASARFVGELLLTHAMRRKKRPVAVVANRVKQKTKAWERLEKFLLSLNIPYPATIRDTQNYVRAFSEGKGIADYPQKSYRRDQEGWTLLLRWLDAQNAGAVEAAAASAHADNIVKLSG